MNVCAVLVNHHGADDIAAAVAALHADVPGLPVVVVDNSDDPAQWDRLATRLPASVCRVSAPANLGFGGGCNLAMRHTDAAFVFLVNPDVRVRPGCTAALWQALQHDATLAAVAPRQFLDDAACWRLPPAELPSAVHEWAFERALRDDRAARRLWGASLGRHLRHWTATEPTAQRALSGSALMVRRRALPDGEPLFDPRLFVYYEDAELCRRLRGHGHRLALVPAAQAVHTWHNRPHKEALMQQAAEVYHGLSGETAARWRQRTQALRAGPPTMDVSRLRPLPAGGETLDLGDGERWLLELSPSPLMTPAIGRFGPGAHVPPPDDVVGRFMGVRLYGRLTIPSRADALARARVYCWHPAPAGEGREG